MNQRIDPERGPVLAAGGVLLAAAVLMLDVRFDDKWATGVHLLIELVAFAVIIGIAWLSPLADRPLAYQATLALTALVVLVPLLFRVADVLGVDDPGSGTLIWIAAVFTAVAWAATLRFDSVGAAILVGVGASLFVLAVIDKVFDPEGVQTFRWVVTLLSAAFAGAAASLMRSERPKFAVAAVDVSGLLIVALALTFAASRIAATVTPFGNSPGQGAPGFGWKLVLIVGSLAVIAYAALTRERGPAFIGTLALGLSVFVIAESGDEPSVIGWPLVLLLAAGAALFSGLRPAGGNGGGGGAPAAAVGTPGPPGGGAAAAPPPPAPGTRGEPPPA